MEEEENINSKIELPDINEAKETFNKKMNQTKNKNSTNTNSKSLNKTNLIVNKDKNINQNSDVNQLFVAPYRDLSYFKEFQGFYNKKFNLTSFKKEKEESRSSSKSPKLRLPHQLRGNGIPKEFKERFTFLNNYYENEKFKNDYEKCPKRNESTFDDLCDFIFNYSKNNNPLDAILLSYYFICHEIKYDYDFKERDEDYKISQLPENVYESGLGLSLGFTNIFEAIFKKLDIRFKHIEGYCKFLPKENNIYMNNLNSTNKKITNNINNKNSNDNSKNNSRNNSFTMYNNNSANSSVIHNSSKYLNNSKFFETNEEESDNLSEYINHCWDSFWYKGEWYLVDSLLGSGSVEIQDKIIDANQIKSKNPDENFNVFYILCWPNYLIYSHFPSENNWQMSDKIWTFKQFLNKYNLNYPKFYKNLFQYKVELITHKEPLIQITDKENLIVKLKVDDYIIEGNVYNPNNGQKISEVRFALEQKQRVFTLEPTFPKIGNYILRINLRAIKSNDLSYRHLFDYRVKVISSTLYNHFEKYNHRLITNRFEREKLFDHVLPKIGGKLNINRNLNTIHKIISDYKKVFPSKSFKRVCYDNEGFYLFEPRSGLIRKGIVIKFRVRIKGVLNAYLLDGNKWKPLKKTEDDVYEGQKLIETENVSICCNRGKNIFTEVFRFKPRKNKYELSHSQAVNKTTYQKI